MVYSPLVNISIPLLTNSNFHGSEHGTFFGQITFFEANGLQFFNVTLKQTTKLDILRLKQPLIFSVKHTNHNNFHDLVFHYQQKHD